MGDPVQFEMAARAVCRADYSGPKAKEDAHVEANWRAWLDDIASGYARFMERQTKDA